MSRAIPPALATLLAALFAAAAAANEVGPVPIYEARYDVAYKGRRVGESVQRVVHEAGTTYRFEATTSTRGLARLLRPHPVVEESRFELRSGALRPLSFRVDDGTRKGEDDFAVDFDWAASRARITTSENSVDVPLEPGVHDRATLQITLMLELQSGRGPVEHDLVDNESVKRYTYEVGGTETLETPVGTLEAVRVVQRREGSSRYTVFWAAPALRHLPVRIEQRRDGETLTTLTLTSIEGL